MKHSCIVLLPAINVLKALARLLIFVNDFDPKSIDFFVALLMFSSTHFSNLGHRQKKIMLPTTSRTRQKLFLLTVDLDKIPQHQREWGKVYQTDDHQQQPENTDGHPIIWLEDMSDDPSAGYVDYNDGNDIIQNVCPLLTEVTTRCNFEQILATVT